MQLRHIKVNLSCSQVVQQFWVAQWFVVCGNDTTSL